MATGGVDHRCQQPWWNGALLGTVNMAATESGESPIGTDVEQAADESAVPPSREELWRTVQDQQDTIEELQDRVRSLEAQADTLEAKANTIEDVAQQFKQGEIGGEAGADLIMEFADVPAADCHLNGLAIRLYRKIIAEYQVDAPVTSTKVRKWLDLDDSANPSVKARRVMERLQRHRDDGFLLGDVELGKHRGKNCIWLKRG